MGKRPAPGLRRPLDIFVERDIAGALEALSGATATPQSVREAPSTPPAESPTPAIRLKAPASSPLEAPKEDAPSARSTLEDANTVPPEPIKRLRQRHIGMKLKLPATMRSQFQTFKAEFSTALGGVFVEDSNIGRSLFEILLAGDDREKILEVARDRAGSLRRPSNSNAVAMAEFDAEIASIFIEARKRRRRTLKHDD